MGGLLSILLPFMIAVSDVAHAQSLFSGSPTVQSFSLPSNATQAQLNSCFSTGNCSNMNAGTIALYPMTCDDGQQCSGCYRWMAGRYQRFSDLSNTGTCDHSNGSVLRVFTAYRMECPNGTSTCANDGRLYLGCQMQKIQGAAGTPDNISNINSECFSGQMSLRIGGREVGLVQNPVTAVNTCSQNTIRFNLLIPPDGIGKNGVILAELTGTGINTSSPITFSITPSVIQTSGGNPIPSSFLQPVTITVTGNPLSRLINEFAAWNTVTAVATFQKIDGSACELTNSISSGMRSVCDAGFQPGTILNYDLPISTCVECAAGTYKSTASNGNCTACAPVANATVTTIPALGATSPGNCTYTCQSGYEFNLATTTCTPIVTPTPGPSVTPTPTPVAPPASVRCSGTSNPTQEPPSSDYVTEYYDGLVTNPLLIYSGCEIVMPTRINIASSLDGPYRCEEVLGGFTRNIGAFFRPATGCVPTGYSRPCVVPTKPYGPPPGWQMQLNSTVDCAALTP